MQSQDLKQFSTTSNSTDGFPHSMDPKVINPGYPKCWTMAVKKTPARAHNSLHLRAGDVEHNSGPTQPCYGYGGATTIKGLESVKRGTRCH